MADRVRSARRGLLRPSHLPTSRRLGSGAPSSLATVMALSNLEIAASTYASQEIFPVASLRRRRAVHKLARLPHSGCLIWAVTT
jgi:hypothetical protein